MQEEDDASAAVPAPRSFSASPNQAHRSVSHLKPLRLVSDSQPKARLEVLLAEFAFGTVVYYFDF
jgi:hypothetical protein